MGGQGLHQPPGVLLVLASRPVEGWDNGDKFSPKDLIFQLLELPLACSDIDD